MRSGTRNVVGCLAVVVLVSWPFKIHGFWFHGRGFGFKIQGFMVWLLSPLYPPFRSQCHSFLSPTTHYPLYTLIPRLNDDEDHALHIEGEDLFLPQHFFHTLNANAAIKALSETNRLQEAVDTFKSRGR